MDYLAAISPIWSMASRFRAASALAVVVLVLGACAPAAPPAPTAAPKTEEKPATKPAEQKPSAPSTAAPAAASATSPAAPATAPVAPTTAPSAKPAASEPRRGGTLRISSDGEWRTLDPAVYSNFTDRQLLYSIYDSLAFLDEDLNIQPGLARSWQVSPDGLTWTFSLRENVKFHDGTPFNAQAVKFNLDRIMDPETASRLRQELLDLQEVQVVDDLTVKIVLKQPFTPLLGWLAEVPGFISSPTAIQQWGKEYGNHPVGTGPFEFVEQVKGDHLTLRRFKDYWQPDLPYVDEVIFRPIPDPSTKLSGLRAGVLEIVDEVPPREQATLQGAPEVELGEMQATRWPMLRLNLAKSPLDNKAVRQALSMAVDREAIVKAVFFGNASPAYGPIAPIYRAVYDPSVAEYGFKRDLEKAKQKLAEGSQANGFSLTLDIGPTPEQTRMAELLKANWAEIGVTAEISTFDANVLTDRLRNGSFQVALGSWTPRPDVDGTVYRHFRTGSAFNYLSYSNPRVDELLDTTRRLPPGDERTKTFRDVQRLIVEDAPWIFMVFENQAFGIAKHVEGLPLVPDTMIRPKTAWLNK